MVATLPTLRRARFDFTGKDPQGKPANFRDVHLEALGRILEKYGTNLVSLEINLAGYPYHLFTCLTPSSSQGCISDRGMKGLAAALSHLKKLHKLAVIMDGYKHHCHISTSN
jgi:hypothetical protein